MTNSIAVTERQSSAPAVLEGGYMSSKDDEYYRQRVERERELALKSENRDIAAIHEELARQYQALLENPQIRRLRVVAEDPERL